MTLDKDTKILIVGLGVIGGGYAAALTRAGFDVCAITKDEETVDYAMQHSLVRYATTEVDGELIREANLIIFALYPTVFIEWVEKYQHLFSPGTFITDVTGVKGSVVEKVQSVLRKDVEFIAHHPMAGRERSGVEYSDPEVFIGANLIITPTERNTREAVELIHGLGKILGFARITELSIEEHDEMIAFLSQLTHCIAVCLMTCKDDENLVAYTGDSFRDLTRIAKINEKMWSELFLMNKDALIVEMDRFIKEFKEMRDMIAGGNREGLMSKMKYSTEKRTLFDKPKKRD